MNSHDADDLAAKLTRTWRAGPSAEVWAEVLGPLHASQARTAYEQLRDELDHAPTVATFRAKYRTLTIDAPAPSACNRCDGYGWLEVPVVRHGIAYTGAKPCTCPAGLAHDRTHTTAIAHNQAQPWSAA
jgi:hypothetical protein